MEKENNLSYYQNERKTPKKILSLTSKLKEYELQTI